MSAPDSSGLARNSVTLPEATFVSIATMAPGVGAAFAVIGGADIFALFLSRADRVELTEVHADYPGDVTMPALDHAWHESARENHPATDKTPAYSFVTLARTLQAERS